MAIPLRAALRSAASFAFRNPTSVMDMARHALARQIAIPLDAVRWFITNTPPGKNAPQDISITSRPPAIAIGLTVELMNTPIRANTKITVRGVTVNEESIRVELELNETELRVLTDSPSPIVGLLKSGMLDLSKPGNLLKFMPKKPAVIVDAFDNVIVLDLMKNPKIRENENVRRVMKLISPVITVTGLSTDGDYLLVSWRANPSGIGGSIGRAMNSFKQLAP